MSLSDRIGEMREMLGRLQRPIGVAQDEEIVIAHPVGRHGIFLREDGCVDIASGTQAVGLSGSGMTVEVQALDVQGSVMRLDADTVWLNTAPDGLVIDGYVPDYGILHGELIARYLRDAMVVITSGSVRPLPNAQPSGSSGASETPVCAQCPALAAVPLSSLLEPVPWSRPVNPRLLERVNEVVRRIGGRR